MEQERLIWELQSLVQEEHFLQRKEELKPLVNQLKDLQESIKNGEEEVRFLQGEITDNAAKSTEIEQLINKMSQQLKGNREKLYGVKGGSLKELLGMQQAIMKTEEELQKTETSYLETLKNIDVLNEKEKKTREIIRALKMEYNEDLKKYKAEKNRLDLKIAEIQLKQEEIKEKLKPEILSLFLDTMKRFPTSPVAYVKGGSCSGCHISIPSFTAMRIRENKSFVSCDSCGRILINKV